MVTVAFAVGGILTAAALTTVVVLHRWRRWQQHSEGDGDAFGAVHALSDGDPRIEQISLPPPPTDVVQAVMVENEAFFGFGFTWASVDSDAEEV